MLAPCGLVESALGAETKARPRAAIKSRFSHAESLAIRVGRIAQDSTLLDVTVRTDTKVSPQRLTGVKKQKKSLDFSN